MSDRTQTEIHRRIYISERVQENPFPPLEREGNSRVYPYPMQDDLTGQRAERELTTVVLDNGLLRLTVLPELGGHIYSLRDLVNDREVFYFNETLKLGLVAMRGAWWAGGVEFNFPQMGHSVTTVDPVSWHLTENQDGSATVYVGAVERLTRMQWTVGMTLHPADLRLHHSICLFNRTPFWNRLYFWTNAAVAARDDFRFLLPASRVYSWWYGAQGLADYPVSGGRDLSHYSTHHHATDLFARDLRADWFGCWYDGLDCGVIHHASRHEVRGRKLWTWGNAEDGLIWADLLSEGAGPYCEIQTGRFVHQGVHRLIAPRAVERWQECWFPAWGLGGVLHATDTMVLNAMCHGDQVEIRLFPLARWDSVVVSTEQGGTSTSQDFDSLRPGMMERLYLTLTGNHPMRLRLAERSGGALLELSLGVREGRVEVIPEGGPPYIDVPDHSRQRDPDSVGDTLLAAREHEENSQPDRAADRYRRALELDPQCVPALNGLAQHHLRRGEIEEGRRHARGALGIDPQSEDALWWLGVASWLENDDTFGREGFSALRALERSTTYAPAAAALAGELLLRQSGAHADALSLLLRALEANPHDSRALALTAYALRRLGQTDEAGRALDRCRRANPLEPLLWGEGSLLLKQVDEDYRSGLPVEIRERALGTDCQNRLEVGCDYTRLGDWAAAAEWWLLESTDVVAAAEEADPPLLLYQRALAQWRLGDVEGALALVDEAGRRSPLFVFPHRLEEAQALELALRLRPRDALAHYLLGTWLASVDRWDQAGREWEQALGAADDDLLRALIGRNQGLKQWRHDRQPGRAAVTYGDALARLPRSLQDVAWRLWLERDRVLAQVGDHAGRVALFDQAPDPVKQHPQVKVRRAEAYLHVGRPVRAAELLSAGDFKPWEGQVSVRNLWKQAHLQLGHHAMEKQDWATACERFEAAASYPRHLNVGRPHASDDAEAHFWAGWCALQAGDADSARRYLTAAATEQQPSDAPSKQFKERAADLLARL